MFGYKQNFMDNKKSDSVSVKILVCKQWKITLYILLGKSFTEKRKNGMKLEGKIWHMGQTKGDAVAGQ